MNATIPSLWASFLIMVLAAAAIPIAAWANTTSSVLASEMPDETVENNPDDLEDAPPPPLPPLRSGPRSEPRSESRGADDEDVPLPPKARSSDELLPAVTITTDDEGQIVEEYAVNGQVYMIKVTPTKGPAYYLFDVDGDGEMESKEFESDPGIKPVYWKILEWD